MITKGRLAEGRRPSNAAVLCAVVALALGLPAGPAAATPAAAPLEAPPAAAVENRDIAAAEDSIARLAAGGYLPGLNSVATGHTARFATRIGGLPYAGVSDSVRQQYAPTPPTLQPAGLDTRSEYQAQRICSPVDRPGTTRLRNWLRATYGPDFIGTSRPCNGSVSEHHDGRALDWMVTVRKPGTKAKGDHFVRYVTAAGPGGEVAAVARRLGIMYIIWNSRMWRAYDPDRGWTEFSNCLSNTSASSDTYCHRDHVHISLSWDGAAGQTSFWTGRAQQLAACRSGTSTAVGPTGSPQDPAVLFRPRTGVGTVGGQECRLAQTRWSGDTRSVGFRVPVPRVPTGRAPAQVVEVDRLAANSPVGAVQLRSSAGSVVNVPAGAGLPIRATLRLGADGIIWAASSVGDADIRVRGLGQTSIALPSVASFTAPSATPPDVDFSLAGTVRSAPAGAVVGRYRLIDGEWRRLGGVPIAADGSWRMTIRPTQEMTLTYRVGVEVGGVVQAWSGTRVVAVRQIRTATTNPKPVVSLGLAPRSKIRMRVNVDPDRVGEANYAYRVQRWNGSGWKRAAEGVTKGARETAILRGFAAGRYRIKVPAQHGLLAGRSAPLEFTR